MVDFLKDRARRRCVARRAISGANRSVAEREVDSRREGDSLRGSGVDLEHLREKIDAAQPRLVREFCDQRASTPSHEEKGRQSQDGVSRYQVVGAAHERHPTAVVGDRRVGTAVVSLPSLRVDTHPSRDPDQPIVCEGVRLSVRIPGHDVDQAGTLIPAIISTKSRSMSGSLVARTSKNPASFPSPSCNPRLTPDRPVSTASKRGVVRT